VRNDATFIGDVRYMCYDRVSLVKGEVVILETMIVQLRQRKDDILAADDIQAPDTAEWRALRLSIIDSAFTASSSEVITLLSSMREETRARYSGLDILSEDSPIESGVVDYVPLVFSHAVAVTATEDVFEQIADSRQIASIHPNYTYEIIDPDPETAQDLLAGLACATDWHLRHLGIPEVHRLTNGSGIKVAVLDTGVDVTHPEFASLVVGDFAEWDIQGNQIAHATPRDTH
jgi:hypothetical protein